MMNHKERISAVIRREPVDRLPVDIWHTDEVGSQLRDHFGAADDLDLYRKMDLDKVVWFFPKYNAEETESLSGAGTSKVSKRTMWGTLLKEQQAGDALYQEFAEPPLKGFDTPGALDRYALWPSLDRFDYAEMAGFAEKASVDFPVLGPWVSLFEIYCQMRGFETALMDLAVAPDLVHATLDRIEEIQTGFMKRLFDLASQQIDFGFVSDDMGSQGSLLISPRMWDEFFKERMRRWCDLIHGYGLKVFYHTDGASEALIPRLLDCGIDVLNPIQHRCPGMDRAELKRKYGNKVIFHGGVDTQQVMPYGTVDDVRREVKECMQTLGKGREGYIVCSCHNIQPGTPLENILAMVETVQASGKP
ncbi:MAG: uroporphyrinogen decarboxylase family protein [Planctomycetota bacterium]